jgi:caffeoyl-CoA O-methyltransferase
VVESAGVVVSPGRSLLPDSVEQYVSALLVSEPDPERRLRAETSVLPEAGMQIGADQGVLLALLIRAIQARNVLEIGTFTGYSALVMARALPEDGQLITCDVNEVWTAVARRYWKEAGLERRITLRLGPAPETLVALAHQAGPGSFDFAFIDADKPAYDGYYEACLSLIRPGGLIALDNMLQHGRVVDPDNREPNTEAIRALNLKIASDSRVDACLLTVGDGVMLVRRH